MQTDKTVAFSGYRPSKLPGMGDANSESIKILKQDLFQAVSQAIEYGYDTFLVGMAEGFDTFAGETILELKKINSHIKLFCILPFDKENTSYSSSNPIAKNADEVIILSEKYTRGAYYVRNEYLVNNSSLLICYYDGCYGGTEYTVSYAQKQGKKIVNLAPKDMEIVKTFDNITNTIREDLERTMQKGSSVAMATSCFSIYAYESLKRRLKNLKKLQFIFTSPTFTQEKISKEIREFYIPRLSREHSLYGTEFEVKLRNELNQKAIAKECADWINKKVTFKSNITNQQMQGFLNVVSDEKSYTYSPLNGFTTADLGTEHGNNAYNFINRLASPTNQAFTQLFDNLWNDKEKFQDVTEEVIESITAVYKENSPEYIYNLALYHIFNEFLEDISEDVLPNEALGFKNSLIWSKLYNFQRDAALAIITKLEKYNGCILADSVGLGKTFTALSIIKYYESRNKDVLVLCPKKLADNWNTYKGNYVNNPLYKDRFAYTVLYHTDLGRERGISNGVDLSKLNWANFGLVVIDESHNFRNGGNPISNDNGDDSDKENRYLRLLNHVIKKGIQTKVLMLSATPVNNRFNDLKNQLALSYEGEAQNLDEKLNTSRSINDIFRNAQKAFNNWGLLKAEQRTTDRLQKMLDFDFFEVLDSVTIARSRKQIEKYYDMKDIGTFPKRNKPISKHTALTSLENAITYNQIFENLMQLNLSVYTPTYYIHESKKDKYVDMLSEDIRFTQGREQGIKKLTAINLMKRIESSVYSFNLTLGRIKKLMNDIIDTINIFEQNGKTKPVSLTDISFVNLDDYDYDDQNTDVFTVGRNIKIALEDMDSTSWKRDLEKDVAVLSTLIEAMAHITPENDSKLQELLSLIQHKIENPINRDNKKIIVFTAFIDTAEYLYKNLSDSIKKKYELNTAMVTGSTDGKCTIPKFKANLNELLTCFSPLSKDKALLMPNNPHEIDILIATDCISEGQNLQDCDYLINYDIHWNPVRIIQRFGRVDRIGSQNECIQLVNFWPDVSLDEYINLKSRVETKMKIVDMTATGDENIISPDEATALEYRKKQLEKLQEEIVDLEDISGGISIMDLGLNEFRLDLLEYIKKNSELEKSPKGLHAIVAQDDTKGGVIFLLKNINQEINIQNRNRLHPFYMVYISHNNDILCDYLSPKEMFNIMRSLCKGKEHAEKELCKDFNIKTNDGKDMSEISRLLNSAISSIVALEEENDELDFLSGGRVSLLSPKIKGIDDFELICFLVVQ